MCLVCGNQEQPHSRQWNDTALKSVRRKNYAVWADRGFSSSGKEKRSRFPTVLSDLRHLIAELELSKKEIIIYKTNRHGPMAKSAVSPSRST